MGYFYEERQNSDLDSKPINPAKKSPNTIVILTMRIVYRMVSFEGHVTFKLFF